MELICSKKIPIGLFLAVMCLSAYNLSVFCVKNRNKSFDSLKYSEHNLNKISSGYLKKKNTSPFTSWQPRDPKLWLST